MSKKMSAAEKKLKEENYSKWYYHYVIKKDPAKAASRAVASRRYYEKVKDTPEHKHKSKQYYDKRQRDPKKRVLFLRSCRQNLSDKMLFLKTYKESVGCEDCKGKFPFYALQFDHVDPKSKIKRATGRNKGAAIPLSWGINRMAEEIKKCRVVCATCHAIKTYQSKDYLSKRTSMLAKHNKGIVGKIDRNMDLLKSLLLEKNLTTTPQ